MDGEILYNDGDGEYDLLIVATESGITVKASGPNGVNLGTDVPWKELLEAKNKMDFVEISPGRYTCRKR